MPDGAEPDRALNKGTLRINRFIRDILRQRVESDGTLKNTAPQFLFPREESCMSSCEIPGEQPDLTVREFTQLTSQSEQSVYRLCRQNKIPHYKIGGSVRIRAEDAAALRRPRSDGFGGLAPELVAEINAAVDNWPPFTAEQRDAIAAIFAEPVGAAWVRRRR
mgnify:CR=1 FL=1|jgi:excisionase family DNA binding protein